MIKAVCLAKKGLKLSCDWVESELTLVNFHLFAGEHFHFTLPSWKCFAAFSRQGFLSAFLRFGFFWFFVWSLCLHLSRKSRRWLPALSAFEWPGSERACLIIQFIGSVTRRSHGIQNKGQKICTYIHLSTKNKGPAQKEVRHSSFVIPEGSWQP